MRNSLLLILSLLLWSGCTSPFSKPVVNIYYVQPENNTTIQPKVETVGDRLRIRTTPREKSAQHYKIPMYFVHKPFCSACKIMKHHMETPEIAALLKKEFNVIMVNIREKETLPKVWMRPTIAPTIYFLDDHQKELISSIHSMSQRKFLETLKEAVSMRDF